MSKHSDIVTNLWTRLKKAPWSLGIALGMVIFFLPHPDWHGDLFYFRTAADSMRHPFWARWIFYSLAYFPEPAAYVLLSVICIALIYFAVRVFGGKDWVVFTSFAFAWTLYYGQIDGLVVGGLALAWWAARKGHPYLVGMGLILASIKPQLAFFAILAIWWWSPSRWKALVVPVVIAGLSFLRWGWWVPGWMNSLTKTDDILLLTRNISLWPLIGWWIWLIWPLVFALPLERGRKLIAIAAATAMSVPYFPLPSAVMVLVMPIPVGFYAALQSVLIANLAGVDLYWVIKILPPALLVWAAWPVISRYRVKWQPI